MYICSTCHRKVKRNTIPCQAAYNRLIIDDTPAELADLQKLEQILISQRIVFEKIVVMPKGKQRKIKGAIRNVSVTCEQTCKILPRAPDSSGIIMLKLKSKLQFKGHVYFEAVRPQHIFHALQWLRKNNELYENIEINMMNIDRQLTSIGYEENGNVCGEVSACESVSEIVVVVKMMSTVMIVKRKIQQMNIEEEALKLVYRL